MSNPNNNTTESPLQAGFDQVKKAYIQGATDTNKSFSSVAGSELQKGNAAAMTVYKKNKKIISGLK